MSWTFEIGHGDTRAWVIPMEGGAYRMTITRASGSNSLFVGLPGVASAVESFCTAVARDGAVVPAEARASWQASAARLDGMRAVNPRYRAYARAHAEPDAVAMVRKDRRRWPGGVMAGFILWIDARWREWDAAHRHPRDHVRSDQEHRAFTAWLDLRWPEADGREVAAAPPAFPRPRWEARS